MKVYVGELPKPHLLKALFDAARSKTHDNDRTMSIEDANSYVQGRTTRDGKSIYISSVKGRELYVDLSGDQIDATIYDKHNGEGSAQIAVDELRQELFQA